MGAEICCAGASVAVECKGGDSKPGFREEVKTDKHGEFRVMLPFSVSKHVKRIEGCSVKLISSNEPYCGVAATATSSSLRLKSRKQGTHIFSAGFFTFKPFNQPDVCNQKPRPQNSKQLNVRKTENPVTFSPPIQDPRTPDLPGIPLLPRLPPLPQLPQLPPLPPLPTLPPLPPLPALPSMPPKPDVLRKQPQPSDEKAPNPDTPQPKPEADINKAQLSDPHVTSNPETSQSNPDKQLRETVQSDRKVSPQSKSLFPEERSISLPPNPFLPPVTPILPPNPLLPPPNPFLPPNPLLPPPAPLIPPFPTIPGITPPVPPPPTFPFPLPPFPFPPPPRFPGIPPASSSSSEEVSP